MFVGSSMEINIPSVTQGITITKTAQVEGNFSYTATENLTAACPEQVWPGEDFPRWGLWRDFVTEEILASRTFLGPSLAGIWARAFGLLAGFGIQISKLRIGGLGFPTSGMGFSLWTFLGSLGRFITFWAQEFPVCQSLGKWGARNVRFNWPGVSFSALVFRGALLTGGDL